MIYPTQLNVFGSGLSPQVSYKYDRASSSWKKHFNIYDHLGTLAQTYKKVGIFGITPTSMQTHNPFGSERWANSNLTETESTLLNWIGKEKDHESKLGDHGFRKYEYETGRFISIDPLWGKYYGWTPYQYSMNSPVMLVDYSGLSPIFDTEGFLLGTDDEGIQGDPIIMKFEDFKQGMSPEKAQKKNLGMRGLVNKEAIDRFTETYENLSERPDWDGYITLDEANEWYRNGGGDPLFAELDQLDLSFYYSQGDDYIGKEYTVSLRSGNSLNDFLVYGSISLVRYPNNTVRAYSDSYDFRTDDHTWWNPLNWVRNIETTIGSAVAGSGRDFDINLYGSKKLKVPFWRK